MTQPLALIVDDEPDICELLEITLSRMGIDAQSVLNLEDARRRLAEQSFDLCHDRSSGWQHHERGERGQSGSRNGDGPERTVGGMGSGRPEYR